MVSSLTIEGIEAVAVATAEEAKKYYCNYTLSTNYFKIKQGNKIGGVLKAIKNADPNAASSFSIESSFILINLSDGTTKTKQKVAGKFERTPDQAATSAAGEGCQKILDLLSQ